jgi:hypothetical protein
VAVAGCTSSAAPTKQASTEAAPVLTTYSWFDAINAKNGTAVSALVAPAFRYIMNQLGGSPAAWPTFSSLECRSGTTTSNEATVHCSFVESQPVFNGNPDSSWTVSLHKQTSSTWLIQTFSR